MKRARNLALAGHAKNPAPHQLMLNAAEDGILLASTSTADSLLNRRFAEMWNLPAALRKGEVLPTAMLPRLWRHLQAQCAEDSPLRLLMETPARKLPARTGNVVALKDGRYLEVITRRLTARQGFSGRIWTVRDITESQQSLLELRKAHRRLELGLLSTKDLVFELDLRRETVFISAPGAEYPVSQARQLIHPDDLPASERALRRHLETGESYDVEYRRMGNLSGVSGYRWIRARGSAVRDETGKPVAFIGCATDITDRREVMEELERSEARYRQILEQAKEVIFEADDALRWRFLSPAWEVITGICIEDCLGKTVTSFLHPDDRPAFRSQVRTIRSAHSVEAKPSEFRWKTADGSYRWLRLWILPNRNGGGESRTFGGTILDVHQQRVAEDERRVALQRVEEVYRARADFLSAVGHELRSPLAGITSACELFALTELTAAQQEYLGVFQSASRHMLHVIDDLLEITRAESGQLAINDTLISLFELIDDLGGSFRGIARKKGLQFDVFAESLPLRLVGDANRLRQVLANLLANAFKFTPSGFVRLWISAQPAGAGCTLCTFRVEDSGTGIPADHLDLIFEKFVQLQPTMNRKESGAGLGLAISRSIARQMGGAIQVSSRLGEGSVFTFQVSLRSAPDDSAALPNVESSLRILHHRIEDPDLRASIETMAAAVGYSTRRVTFSPRQRGALPLEENDLLLLQSTSGLGVLPQALEQALAAGARCAVIVPASASDLHLPEGVMRLERPLTPSLLRALSLEHRRFPDRIVANETHAPSAWRIPPKLLLVDDNADNRSLLQALLGERGCHVECAASGAQAVAMADSRRYDLVFMDLEMPSMDGFEATRRIRESEFRRSAARTPVIALSAHAEERIRTRCMEAGMDAFVAKPATSNELMHSVRTWVDPRPVILAIHPPADDTTRWLTPILDARQSVLIAVDSLKQALAALGSQRISLVLYFLPNRRGEKRIPASLTRSLATRGIPVATVLPPGVSVETVRAAGRSGDPDRQTSAVLSMDNPLDFAALAKRIALPAGSPQSGEIAVAASVLPVGGTPASSQESITPAIQALVPEYLDNQRKELAKMRALLPQGEFRTIQRFGHNLKGTAGGYGVPALGKLGARLEAAAAEGNTTLIAEILAEIGALLERTAILHLPHAALAGR